MNKQRRDVLSAVAVFALPASWELAFMLVPYGIMIAISFWTRRFPLFVPDFQFGNFAQIVSKVQYSTVVLRTFKISTVVTIGSLVLGYPLAYFLAFTVRLGWLRSVLYMLVVVPLWVSYLLRTYTWKIILGADGVLNSLLISLHVIKEPLSIFLYNQTAMVITLIYIFVPFVVMPLFAVLNNIPKAYLEASEDLGVGPFLTFWNVILPLSAGGIIAGCTLTFCLCFGDFVAPALVGGPDGTMIANVLQSLFGASLNWPLGSALATIVLVLVLVVLQLSGRVDRAGRIDLR